MHVLGSFKLDGFGFDFYFGFVKCFMFQSCGILSFEFKCTSLDLPSFVIYILSPQFCNCLSLLFCPCSKVFVKVIVYICLCSPFVIFCYPLPLLWSLSRLPFSLCALSLWLFCWLSQVSLSVMSLRSVTLFLCQVWVSVFEFVIFCVLF